MLTPLALGMPGPFEWIIIAGIGLLVFGKRLPEVGRGLAKSIVEFKKGLKGIDEDIEVASNQPSKPSGAKFDPYTGKPLDQNATPPTAG